MMPIFIDITQLEYREIRLTILLVEGDERAQLQQQRQGLIVEQITNCSSASNNSSKGEEQSQLVFTIGNLPFSYLSTIDKKNINNHLKS